MSHGVCLVAILDFAICDLRKLIISITFEPSDIETQTIPSFYTSQARGTYYLKVNFAIQTFLIPQHMYLNAENQAKPDIVHGINMPTVTSCKTSWL